MERDVGRDVQPTVYSEDDLTPSEKALKDRRWRTEIFDELLRGELFCKAYKKREN